MLGDDKTFREFTKYFLFSLLNMDEEYVLWQKLFPIVFAINEYNRLNNERVSVNVAAALYALLSE